MTEPPSGPLTDLSILIIEDEYFLAQDMTRAFEAAGATVVGPVSNIDDALDLIAGSERLDGAVLDINLQGEMAYPVAEALRARTVPFVFATGYEAAHIQAPYRQVPRYQKPVEPDDVATALFPGPRGD